jgi:LuxR family transcriptional regulator, maltose regulon positive regulatory protein
MMARFPNTKFLFPLLRHDYLKRNDLLRYLQTTIPENRLLLVCAPAGYGKTTLLVSLPTVLHDARFSWLSLDEYDNDPSLFLAALAQALIIHLPAFEESVTTQFLTVNMLGGPLLFHQALNELINCATNIDYELILIIDDFHFITNTQIYEALNYLLDHMPPRLHIVLSTRHIPPLHIQRLRARRQLTMLTIDDLRFDCHETDSLLNELLHLDLSASMVNDLHTIVEGWPAGLILLINHLHQYRPIEKIAHIEKATFDYFAEEIITNLPQSLHDFLLETSILDELTPDLCDRVREKEDSAILLAEIYNRNLFLSLIQPARAHQEPIYRYHSLFAEFLRHEFFRLAPERFTIFHRRAANILKNPAYTIAHIIAIQDWEAASALLEEIGEEYMQQGLHVTLLRWIESIPEEVRSHRYRLLYYQGYAHFFSGDILTARMCLEQSYALVDSAPYLHDPADSARVLVALASLAFAQAHFEECDQIIGRIDPAFVDNQVRLNFLMLRASLVLFIHTEGERGLQDLKEAIEITRASDTLRLWYQLALYLGPKFATIDGACELLEHFCLAARERYDTHMTPLRLGIQDTWTGIHLRRGRVHQAIEMAKDTLMLQHHLGGYTFLGTNATATLIAAHIARREYDIAEIYIEHLLDLVKGAPLNQALIGGGYYQLGRLRWIQGRYEEARQAMESLQAIETPLPHVVVLQQMLAALFDICEKRYARAEKRLLELKVMPRKIAEVYGSANFLLAYVYYCWEQPTKASQVFYESIEDVMERDCPGVIALEMPFLQHLIPHIIKREKLPKTLLALFDELNVPLKDSDQSEIHLTTRQIEVLQLIALGYSNQAIADHFTLSLTTVKSHVFHIMNSLGASSRTEAVALARQKQLL